MPIRTWGTSQRGIDCSADCCVSAADGLNARVPSNRKMIRQDLVRRIAVRRDLGYLRGELVAPYRPDRRYPELTAIAPVTTPNQTYDAVRETLRLWHPERPQRNGQRVLAPITSHRAWDASRG